MSNDTKPENGQRATCAACGGEIEYSRVDGYWSHTDTKPRHMAIPANPNATTQEPPRFKHDCDACKYLGRYDDFDLYFCQKNGPTSVRRWGTKSSACIASCAFHVQEAKRRAIAAGLLPAEPSGMGEVLSDLAAAAFGPLPQLGEPSGTITIAEVAAKLGLERDYPDDYVGLNPFTKSGGDRDFYLFEKNHGETGGGAKAGWGWEVRTETDYSARQVCELAGVDYERYEGREPEPVKSGPSGEPWGCGADRWEEESKALEYGSPAWVELWCLTHDEAEDGTAGAYTCLLDGGHDGPHVWTPDFTAPSMANTRALWYQRGLEAGRAERAKVAAELLAAAIECAPHVAWAANFGGVSAIVLERLERLQAAIAQAEALGKGDG